MCRMWVDIPYGEGQFRRLSEPLALAIFAAAVAVAFAAKGIIQSSIMSVAELTAEGIIRYARQAQIIFRKFLGAGRQGWWDCTAWAKSDICNCRVLRTCLYGAIRAFSSNSTIQIILGVNRHPIGMCLLYLSFGLGHMVCWVGYKTLT